jgi:hypothetical protein
VFPQMPTKKFLNPIHDDCPKKPRGRYRATLKDRYGQWLYVCSACDKKTVEAALRLAAREARMKD